MHSLSNPLLPQDQTFCPCFILWKQINGSYRQGKSQMFKTNKQTTTRPFAWDAFVVCSWINLQTHIYSKSSVGRQRNRAEPSLFNPQTLRSFTCNSSNNQCNYWTTQGIYRVEMRGGGKEGSKRAKEVEKLRKWQRALTRGQPCPKGFAYLKFEMWLMLYFLILSLGFWTPQNLVRFKQ